MAEQVNLPAPDQATPGTSDYSIVYISLARKSPEGPYIAIGLEGSGGYRRAFKYEGEVARQMIAGLNTANLSTKSLERRILERLIADGKLAGTIVGTPDAP